MQRENLGGKTNGGRRVLILHTMLYYLAKARAFLHVFPPFTPLTHKSCSGIDALCSPWRGSRWRLVAGRHAEVGYGACLLRSLSIMQLRKTQFTEHDVISPNAASVWLHTPADGNSDVMWRLCFSSLFSSHFYCCF